MIPFASFRVLEHTDGRPSLVRCLASVAEGGDACAYFALAADGALVEL
ncbi:MAG: hypothetical protein H0V44_15425 [Planctomycetes bacterium]|nr:hypothetical protein [Planctomycetota bacterium]